MKPKHARNRRPTNRPANANETDEIERMKKGIIEVLVKTGGYEPAVDDITLDLIIRSKITYTKLGALLNSVKATEYTYSRVIDGQVKLAKIINDGLHQLAISRHDRLEKGLTDSNSNTSAVNSTIEKYVQAMSEDEQATLSKTIMRLDS